MNTKTVDERVKIMECLECLERSLMNLTRKGSVDEMRSREKIAWNFRFWVIEGID